MSDHLYQQKPPLPLVDRPLTQIITEGTCYDSGECNETSLDWRVLTIGNATQTVPGFPKQLILDSSEIIFSLSSITDLTDPRP